MRMTLILIVIAAAVVTTDAQIMSNPAQWYINNQIYSMRVFNSTVGTSMVGKKGAKSSSTKPSQPAAKADITAFKSSPQNILPARLGARDADAKKQLEGFIDLYRQTARKDGFPADDIAYAFEYFVVNNYQLAKDLVDMPADKDPYLRNARDGFDRISLVSKKRTEMVTMYQERAVYQQFRTILGGNPEIAKLTDAQKQEATELLAIMYGVNLAAYLKGIDASDDKLIGEAQMLAEQGLEKLLGTTFANIRITNNGLEF